MKMSIENSLPKRKELRLKQFNYSSAGTYFVTICIKDRKRILSNIVKSADGADPKTVLTEIGKIVEKNLLSSENIPGVKIDRYVIMPDHIHAIIYLYPMEGLEGNGSSKAPTPTGDGVLGNGSSRAPTPTGYGVLGNGSSRAPTPTNQRLPHIISTLKRFCTREIGSNIFQRGYIEHIIRDNNDYDTKVKYIYENPIRLFYDELYSE